MNSLHIIASGCSFTKDLFQKTWPDYLAQSLNVDIVNIGARGAGIDFTVKRIMYYCSQHQPDLVIVMLPSVDRFDWFLDDQHPLLDSANQIASWQNGKNSSLVNLDGTLSQSSGYCLTGGEMRSFKTHWFKYYYSEASAQLDYWVKVYQLQLFLLSRNINFCFSTAYDRDYLVEQSANKSGANSNLGWIFDLISWEHFVFYKQTSGFLSFVKDYKFQIKKNHPETLAHEAWTKQILLTKIFECVKRSGVGFIQ
jgi:hypothetical protein